MKSNDSPYVRAFRLAIIGVLALIGSRATASAQTVYVYQILHSFTGNDGHGWTGDTDGANPAAALVQGADGYFYGTTVNGSASNTAPRGTVFRIDAAGNLTIVHHFLGVNSTDAVNPWSRLIPGDNGYFYGTTWDTLSETAHGGGALYKVNAADSYSKLYTFDGSLGAGPYAALVRATDGNFYGTTTRGGGHLGGSVFKNDGGINVYDLHDFTDSGGYNYFKSELFQAADGNFYGVTHSGGTSNFGTAFKVTTGGSLTRIHNFTGTAGLEPSHPLAGFIQGADGYLYGTSSDGGLNGYGTVFKMDYNGTVTIVHNFTYTDGSDPRAKLLQAADGNFYGTTYGGGTQNKGTVYRITPRAIADFNRDNKTDRTIFRPSAGAWYSALSDGTSTATAWGLATDVDVAGDYDGDGIVDVAVWRPSIGTWYIVQSATGTIRTDVWGLNGDTPLAGDVDGDFKDDLVIFRAGSWYVKKSTTGTIATVWGVNGDQPVLGDFDGDGMMDLTIFRPASGVWYIKKSSGGQTVTGWGTSGDVPVIGDFDGDHKSDPTVFRPSTGQWFVSKSTGGTAGATWGLPTDIPVAGDWDGDGVSDFTIWRASSGAWYTLFAKGATAAAVWGLDGDRPIGRRPGS